jgi:hypothetical protein
MHETQIHITYRTSAVGNTGRAMSIVLLTEMAIYFYSIVWQVEQSVVRENRRTTRGAILWDRHYINGSLDFEILRSSVLFPLG